MLAVLVCTAIYGIPRLTAKRFDGSSPEAFETSLAKIRDSLDDHERATFDNDMQGVLQGLCLDDVSLFRASMAAGFARRFGEGAAARKQNDATTALRVAASKKLDGKTLDEFRAIAAEGRERWEERLQTALGDSAAEASSVGVAGNNSNHRATAAPKKPLLPVGNIEDLLSEIDDIKTETREVESADVAYQITVPVGTKIEGDRYTDYIELTLPSGEQGKLYGGQYKVKDRFNNEDNIVVTESIVVQERPQWSRPGSNESIQRGLLVKANIQVSKWRWFHIGIENPIGVRNPQPREAALCLLRAARSLTLKSPDPEDTIKLLGALDIEYSPNDAPAAQDVTSLKIDSLQHLELLRRFPNLSEVKIEDIEFLDADTDLEPVWGCNNLVSLDLDVPLTRSMIDDITNGLQRLETVIINPKAIARQDLEALAELPALHTVGLKTLPERKDTGLGLLAFTKLRCVRIGSHEDNDFSFLGSLTMPEIVLQYVKPGMVEVAARNQNLTSVTLNTMDAEDLRSLIQLPALRHLSIRIGGDGENLTAQLFRRFAKSRLESLEFSAPYVAGSPEEEIAKAISEIKSLKKLRFQLGKPSREAIIRLLDMPNLRELSADRYSAFEWNEFEEELQKRPHIKFK